MSRQRGFFVPLVLAVLLIGMLFVQFAPQQLAQTLATERTARTRGALAAATEGILGYALSYPQSHQIQRYGVLPCPDTDGDGKAEGNCGVASEMLIGHVPYVTLGIAPPLDGNGNCIWYAVSAEYKVKNSPAGTFNWDSLGQFQVASAAGQSLTGSQPHRLAAAVLIAPGVPLTGQNRSGSANPCRTAAGDEAAFMESRSGGVPSAQQQFATGTSTSLSNNDQLAWLQPDEIFGRLERNRYFIEFMKQRMGTVAAVLGNPLAPQPSPGLLGTIAFGPLPSAKDLVDAGVWPFDAGNADYQQTMYDDWSAMFRYFRCTDGSACLSVDIAGTPSACRVVIGFSGARAPGQSRGTLAERADPAQYFEGSNLAAVQSPTMVFESAPDIALDPPWQDVFRCVD